MAAGIFNIAKGKLAYYAGLPAASDALIVVLLSANEVDDTLNNYDDLGALIAAVGNTEATFTGYARVTAASVTVTVDDTANNVKVDFADPQWSPTSAQTLTKLLVCYDGDTAAGTDANIIPLFYDDFAVTTPTSGTVTYNVAAAGFYTAS